jgi:hypothetical protein
MENEAEKKFFRLQHIIPRDLSSASVKVSAGSSPSSQIVSVNAPEEFVFKTVFGNLAGIPWLVVVRQVNSIMNYCFYVLKAKFGALLTDTLYLHFTVG